MSRDVTAESGRLIVRGLALEKARLQLSVPSLDPQPAVVPHELIEADGFSFVTLLAPGSPTLWLPPDTPVEASGQLHGAKIHLTCRLRQIVSGDREWQLQVGWPEQVHHIQRRLAFRADVPMDHPSRQAVLKQADVPAVPAVVLDLSMTGIGLQPPSGWRPQEDAVLQCELPRPEGGVIRSDLEIRHISHADRGLRIGARFSHAEEAELRALRSLINGLQRFALQRRKTD